MMKARELDIKTKYIRNRENNPTYDEYEFEFKKLERNYDESIDDYEFWRTYEKSVYEVANEELEKRTIVSDRKFTFMTKTLPFLCYNTAEMYHWIYKHTEKSLDDYEEYGIELDYLERC